MKQVLFLTLLMLLSTSVWGQAAPAQNSSPQAPPAQAGPMHHGMHHHQMMQQHMRDMKAQLDTMHAKIADLKANLGKVKDPATKQALQADLDLWESMAGHMEAMQKMMPPMGPGMAMQGGARCPCCAEMMKQGGSGMGCCGGNKCMQGKPSTPAAPEAPAPPAN
jgi:TolA-binding protein